MTAKAWKLICFESQGIPVSLYGEKSARRAIETGSLTPQMSVVVYEGEQGVRMPAAEVVQLRRLFDPAVLARADSIRVAEPPPPPPPGADEAVPEPETVDAPPVARPPPPASRPARQAEPLPRGGNVNLSRAAPELRTAIVGLGWDTAAAGGHALDLDIIVFIQTAHGKVRYDADVVFYNNPTGAHGAVRLHVPPTREPSGDVQWVTIELDSLGTEVSRLSFAVAIYEGAKRSQNFGMVEGAYIRVLNADDGAELARCNMSSEQRMETAIVFGEIYNRSGEWKFRAVDQGFSGGLPALAKSFGVDIEGGA